MKFLLKFFALGCLFSTVWGTSCREGEFDCKDENCLPLDSVCDRIKDCHDGSDEINCQPPPPCDKFKCDKGYKCIPYKSVCDGWHDCYDGSDESPGCECLGFSCKNGTCIPKEWECNGYDDCRNKGDDEHQNCEYPPCEGFQCGTGLCIQSDWVCDGYYDCQYGEDERNCGCNEGEFFCHDGFGCLSEKRVCDGFRECLDGSDETDCQLVDMTIVEKAKLSIDSTMTRN